MLSAKTLIEPETKLDPETCESKKIFFTAWRKQAQKLKLKKLMDAANFFHENFDFNRFNELSTAQKFLLIKNILLLGHEVRDFLGARGLRDLGKIKECFQEIISHFDEQQRFCLAQIDVERNGIKTLSKYRLSADQEILIVNKAKAQVKEFLPSFPDELIEKCVRENDKDTLQFYIFERFSGPFQMHFPECKSDVFEKLHSATSVSDLAMAFKNAMPIQEEFFLQNGWFRCPSLSFERPNYWGKDNSVKSHEMISFSHGGGFYHILKFLHGKTAGYRLERGGNGLQVSPGNTQNDRDAIYARRAYGHYDHPARLSGKIKAKYLDSANNSYEAGLRRDFIEFIEEMSITRLDTGSIYKM